MKKLLFLVFTLGISLLCLFSCASDVTIYSKSEDLKASVIVADLADNSETEGYNSICDALSDLVGRGGFYSKTDVYLEAAGEIIIGHTNRTATAKAEALLSAGYYDDGDTEAYVIYVYNGSVAIVASSDFALPIAVDYFIENYLVGDKLVVRSDLVELKSFSVTAYKAAQDKELSDLSDAEFARRWDEATAKLPPEAVDALQRLYAFYGTDWATWLFNLYDPETGCFYYSNSARDYEGFFVDLESTSQTFSILENAGLFKEFDNVFVRALPLSMREKCLAYVQSMQDPDDGYFYHPQWGSDINSSRRGRDLESALGIIRRLGGVPLYDSALDNLGDKTGPVASLISSFMDTDSHKSTVAATVDERFQSEEKMQEYLDGLVKSNTNSRGYFDSFTFGHILSSETRQIVAAGLGDFVCDYIDGLQDPETGFFEVMDPNNVQAGYQAASGVIKISAFYSSVNGAIKYGEKMLDSIIDIILSSVKTSNITYVFNPWGALSSAISSIKLSNENAVFAGGESLYDETKLMQKIYTKLPALITATIEKLEKYKHDDGSYSFLEDGTSLVNNQGVITSLGYNEGDVNGTACAMDYILGSLFSCLDIKRVPMLRYSDYIQFRDILESAGSVVKQQLPAPELLDFEEFDGTDLPARVNGVVSAEGEKLEVIDFVQKNGEEGKVLAIHSITNKHVTTRIEAKGGEQNMQCFTLSFDLYVDSAETGAIYQIFLRNTNQNDWNAYMLDISAGGGAVYIRDNENNGGGAKDNPQDLEITEKFDTWFNLKIEYYVLEDPETGKTVAKIKLYKNGVCVKVSDNYFVNPAISVAENQAYLADSTGTVPKPAAINGINLVEFFARVGPSSKILLDNIDCIPSSSAIFSDADVVPGAGAMVEPDTVTNDVIDFESGELDSDLFTASKENVISVVTRPTITNADNKAYKVSSIDGSSQIEAKIGMAATLIKRSVFTFEADVCVDDVLSKAGDGCFQIAFSDTNKHAFLLALDVDSANRVRLRTWNSFGGNAVIDLGVDAPLGEWFNLKLEYYPISDTEAHIVVYVDGERVGESDNFYCKIEEQAVITKINSITIYDRSAAQASLYLDNIRCSYDATKEYTPKH